MAKTKSVQTVSAQTLFDVPAQKREIGNSTKKKVSSNYLDNFDLQKIGLNAGFERDGHALKNRNNSI